VPILFRDFETRSFLDLSEVGVHRYMADESTQVLCCSFAADDGPVQLWMPGKPPPEVWSTAAADSNWLVVAHNDQFETAVEARLGWPVVAFERHRCTAAMARACALPGSLDGAAEALGLEIRKDRAGARLMKQIATRKIEPTSHDLEILSAYCRRDTELLRALFKRLPPLIEAEHGLWILDQQINARGFAADRKLAEAMRDVAVKRRAEIAAELTELTGLVTSPNQTARILQWLNSRGYNPHKLDKKAKAKLLSQTLPRDVQRVLELVAEGALKTIDKADALLASIGEDGRIRDPSTKGAKPSAARISRTAVVPRGVPCSLSASLMS
jgi:DNA polymerase bacteriophage-type